MRKTFHLIILRSMIKPSRTNRNITLCRGPIYSIWISLSHLCLNSSSDFYHRTIIQRPTCILSQAILISNPTNISLVTKNNCIWRQFTDNLHISIPIILLAFSIRALSTGTIQPNNGNLPILSQQLFQLILIILIIFRRISIKRTISIPWTKINSKI